MASARDDGDRNPTDKSEWLPRDPKGHRLIRVTRNLILFCILLDVVVAIYTFTQVPLDTTTRYTRYSKEYEIPIFVLFGMPTVLALLWLRSCRAAYDPLPPNERKILFALGIPMLSFMMVSQFVVMRDFLEAGSSLG